MFEEAELELCSKQEWFKAGYNHLERCLMSARLGIRLGASAIDVVSMTRFSEAVMSSVSSWPMPREGLAREMCLLAADIETGLGVVTKTQKKDRQAHRHFFRAAILYDAGGMPSAAAAAAKRNGLDDDLKSFFGRSPGSVWGALRERAGSDAESSVTDAEAEISQLFEAALGEAIKEECILLQAGDRESSGPFDVLSAFKESAGHFALGVNASEVSALTRALELRGENTSLDHVTRASGLSAATLRAISMPMELWPVQRKAIETGLFSEEIRNYGLAAPTGTGKTALTKALIASALERDRKKKVVYVSPSRALVHQVAADLAKALQPAGFVVRELGAHLTVHEQLDSGEQEADVLIFTPERADLLLRIAPDFVESIGLVIVDEAHHIEQGSRGILLEFYLWRLRQLIPASARVIQLSAVAPNIEQLVDWLGPSESAHSTKIDWRANRLRLGIFERRNDGRGVVQFQTGTPFVLFAAGAMPSDRIKGISLLANKLSRSGVVLVLCMSPGSAEKVALELGRLRASVDTGQPLPPELERVDARVERELFPDASLRRLLKHRVVYHHAQLPPRVRSALEDSITAKQVDIVCATTTLAEGVNFPFATVLVESLVGKNYQLTPRALWNIAGRAGRFGVDSEGHCIIFEPSSFEAKLKPYKLADYMRTRLAEIPPVRSALATALEDLKDAVRNRKVTQAALNEVSLAGIAIDGKPASEASKRLRGAVNLVRIGFTHASTSKLIGLDDKNANELTAGVLASRQMDDETKAFADTFGVQQRKVIGHAFAGDDGLLRIAAKIGWSLETQSELHAWLESLEDWRLERFGKIVIAGRLLDPNQLGYLLGPVSKFMSEVGGEKLGGVSAFVSRFWIEGLPLTSIRDGQREKNIGRLVHMIYARVQYLLPWALYGVSELADYEAKRRSIKVQDGIRDLSVLAAEGVPNFDALQLVMRLGLERVDATRIAAAYHRIRPLTDITGFLRGLPWPTVAGIVRSPDNRRLDPDLRGVWQALQTQASGLKQ